MSLKCFGNIWSGVMPMKNKMIGMQMRIEEQESGLWTQSRAAHNCNEYTHSRISSNKA